MFLGLIASLNSPNERYNLPTLPTTHPTPSHPLIHAACDIAVALKKIDQNPAVLAS